MGIERGVGEIKELLYADVRVLVIEKREHLQNSVNEFERAYGRIGLKINVGKNKVLVVKKHRWGSCEKVKMNGEG